MRKIYFCVVALLWCAHLAVAQQVRVKEVVLENGLRLLLVARKGDPNIAAGWIARVGSVNERPGITGVSHLLEHLMFKGTHTIGTNNIAENLKVLDEMDRLQNDLAREREELAAKQRRGEITNTQESKVQSPRHRELLAKFDTLGQREKELTIKDEFDRIYTTAGASGMNAGTANDYTLYFINVPASKLELWFWMESDRLMKPVFREFYAERDVVLEERRLRINSTPTGRFDELFDAMFWQSSPYGFPVIGWPGDIEGMTRREVVDYFSVHYAPNNLTACLVGDFNPEHAVALANKYFKRIPRGAHEPSPVRTYEMKQLAEQRMVAYAETSPGVIVRYHTVADGHKDESALLLLADLLNGRTGRLYKSLVLEEGVANDASAFQEGRKYEGFFELKGTARPGHNPEDVEQALYREIEKLQNEKIVEQELQKVKNQNVASDFRQLQTNPELMVQLLVRDTYRGWQTINTDPASMQTVTVDDIKRVAISYFTRENRTVGIYHTTASDKANKPPMLAPLDK